MKHGGINQLNLDDPSSYLDLSVNINPYGPPEGLMKDLASVDMRQYPDPDARKLRDLIARRAEVTGDKIALGNGASELLWAAVRAMARPGGLCVTLRPSFSEVAQALQQAGADWKEIEEGQLEDVLATGRVGLLSLCNPNSPTGRYRKAASIAELSSRYPRLSILLDESFLSLSDWHEEERFVYPSRVLRVRSLTKDFAIAGLRLGYALGDASLIGAVSRQLPTWNINAIAQAVGCRISDDPDFLSESRRKIFEDRAWIERELDRRGIAYIPSCTIFILFQDRREDLAAALLARHKILIRACETYGLKGHYRIAVRPQGEMQRFFAAYDQLRRAPC